MKKYKQFKENNRGNIESLEGVEIGDKVVGARAWNGFMNIHTCTKITKTRAIFDDCLQYTISDARSYGNNCSISNVTPEILTRNKQINLYYNIYNFVTSKDFNKNSDVLVMDKINELLKSIKKEEV